MTEIPEQTEKTVFDRISDYWQFLVAIIIVFIFAMGVLFYFWPNFLAVQGMNTWVSKVPTGDAQPVKCMMRDTNSDGYISCTVLLNNDVVPLECGVSVFNIGCRVTYGSVAPRLQR